MDAPPEIFHLRPVSSRLAAFAWGVLGWNVLVILWGAYVRASGSGAGCGSHWPLCNGEALPRDPQLATIIEFTHRLTSGLALIGVVALLVWVFRRFPRPHQVRKAATATLVFILLEALIGALLVKFELVAENKSVARAVYLSVHLVNTFLLLGALSLTAWLASGARRIRASAGPVMWLLLAGLATTLLVGVSGAIAALGDTLFPVRSVAEGIRQELSSTSHFLIRLRLLHPTLAITAGVVTAVIGGVMFRRAGLSRSTRTFAAAVVAIVAVQLGVGFLNVYLLAPIWMQMVHLLLADATWVLMILLSADALADVQSNGPLPAAASLLKV
jgi:heme A synthase